NSGETGIAVLDGDASPPGGAPDVKAAAAPVVVFNPGPSSKPFIPPIKLTTPAASKNNAAKPIVSNGPLGGAIYGALDLGTNNCRLLVARPSRRGFYVIDAFSRIIKLGEGVSHSGYLSEDAIGRTIEA